MTERSISICGNGYLFSGWRWDAESGLYYYRARIYNAQIGRFCSRRAGNPIGYADGINWYAYCGNNPVMLVDPFGLCGDCGVLGNMWRGAVMGDFAGHTGWAGVGTQVGVGWKTKVQMRVMSELGREA